MTNNNILNSFYIFAMLKFLFVLSFNYILNNNPCEGRESLLTDKILSTRLEQGNVNMKLIKVGTNDFAKVDDKHFVFLSSFKWCLKIGHGGLKYARCYTKGHQFLMHRVIMGITDSNVFIDHIDGNGLNNQESNLRLSTDHQNKRNWTKKNTKTSSIYKGVSKNRGDTKWIARINVNRKKIYLGRFDNETDAATEYNKAAKEYFGDFCKLNHIS